MSLPFDFSVSYVRNTYMCFINDHFMFLHYCKLFLRLELQLLFRSLLQFVVKIIKPIPFTYSCQQDQGYHFTPVYTSQ